MSTLPAVTGGEILVQDYYYRVLTGRQNRIKVYRSLGHPDRPAGSNKIGTVAKLAMRQPFCLGIQRPYISKTLLTVRTPVITIIKC